MRRARWLAPWKDSAHKRAIYHCISRVVDRRLVFGDEEKERFVRLMRRHEVFTGCRVLAHCVMGNHVHLLLEVPPRPANGLGDDELLHRLRAWYDEARVAEIEAALALARAEHDDRAIAEIHARYSYRMHDLSQFMKGLMQRFTQWYNRARQRTGTLWEDRFKSVIVEDGVAARAVAVYIDLNPVRAGIVPHAADYRWSSFGEAAAGNKHAQSGLAAAWQVGRETPRKWNEGVACEYEQWLSGKVMLDKSARQPPVRCGHAEPPPAANAVIGPLARMLRQRVRHFADGAVIGAREFVEEVFQHGSWRFGLKRRTGARRMRGAGAAAAGLLWAARDLRLRV